MTDFLKDFLHVMSRAFPDIYSVKITELGKNHEVTINRYDGSSFTIPISQVMTKEQAMRRLIHQTNKQIRRFDI